MTGMFMKHGWRAAFGRSAVAVLIAGALASSSCGYTLAGRGSFLPSYIKTIGLPLFGNITPVPDVERKITDAVRAELIGRGRYTITQERTGVDAVLTGDILHIGIVPAAFNNNQQATRYAITVVAKIEFRDLKTDKVIWQNPALAFTEQYDVTSAPADAAQFLGQNQNALQRVANEFARTVVSAILEAF
ncbi:MAG TPA: LPS assembly lipoprotein LptE [Vicinamibacterales bacterium]|nr:LPS assembly lipoprotein LptE [Vicinamibacterales bacterium]